MGQSRPSPSADKAAVASALGTRRSRSATGNVRFDISSGSGRRRHWSCLATTRARKNGTRADRKTPRPFRGTKLRASRYNLTSEPPAPAMSRRLRAIPWGKAADFLENASPRYQVKETP
jgi:hypothetical protein